MPAPYGSPCGASETLSCFYLLEAPAARGSIVCSYHSAHIAAALDACPLDSAFKNVLACVHQRLMELNKTSALDPVGGLSPVRLLPRLGIIFLPCRALLLQEGGTQALPLECLASSALALATSSS